MKPFFPTWRKERESVLQQTLTHRGYSPVDNKHVEGAFTQGNGYLNLRGAFEEDLHGADQTETYWRLPANVTLEKPRHPKSKWGLYVPGVYGLHPLLGEEIINLPHAIGINLLQDGEKLDMERSRISRLTRSLELSNGRLRRSFTWHRPAGRLDVTFERYCSLQHKHLIVQEVRLRADVPMGITFESFIDADVTTNGYRHFTSVSGRFAGGVRVIVTTDSGQTAGLHAVCEMPGEAGRTGTAVRGGRWSESWRLVLEPGREISVRRHVLVAASVDDGYPGDMDVHLDRLLQRLREDPPDFARHAALWADRWRVADIVICGDDRLQEAVRFAICHLLRAANDSERVSIDAKGFAGEAYFGHYFWDTEIYLLPFFIYVWPEQAKKLLTYRYHMLPGARENARRYGYAGARHPWESLASGTEQCSNWQYADLEIHVTADIVYGMWHYAAATGDWTFLFEKALPVMVETARYWVSRADRKDGKIQLIGVMGPDEYLPFTRNNAFTNYMVKFSLAKTLDALEMAEACRPDCVAGLRVTPEEKAAFREMAEHLVFPEDRRRKFIWQSEDFDQFLDVDFGAVWKDRSKPFGHFISQERNYRSKALKQADTVALLCLFRDHFDEETKRNCLNYYEPLTTHDSSLSAIFHALLCFDIGETEKALAYLQTSLGLDLERKGAAEGIHIANCGGIWQAVVMGMAGFAGLLEGGKPVFRPRLPKHVESMAFHLHLSGDLYLVHLDHGGVRMERLQKGGSATC